MAEETENTKSPFLFVKPGSSNIEQFKCYCGDKPVHAFELSGWEWLLERILRRGILLSNFATSTERVIKNNITNVLRKYSIIREPDILTRFPVSYKYDRTPYFDKDAAHYEVNHDGSRENLETSRGALANWQSIPKASALPDIANYFHWLSLDAAGAQGSHDSFYTFLDPSWTPPQNGYKSTASVTVTSGGSYESFRDSEPCWKIPDDWCKTKVTNRTALSLPEKPFFPALADVKIDDGVERKTIEYKGENITVYTTKVVGGMKPSEALASWGDSQVRYGNGRFVNSIVYNYYGAVALAFKARPLSELDDGEKTGSSLFSNVGTADDAESIFGKPPGDPIAVRISEHYCYFYPNISWNGHPSWWLANGFPKGLEFVKPDKLNRQIQALCKAPPAIPPCIPGLFSGKIENNVEITNSYAGYTYHDLEEIFSYQNNTINPLAITPFNVAKSLDELTKTLHRIPGIFVEFTAEENGTHIRVKKTYDSVFKNSSDSYNKKIEGTEIISRDNLLSGFGLHSPCVDISTGTYRDEGVIDETFIDPTSNRYLTSYTINNYTYNSQITLKHVTPLIDTRSITPSKRTTLTTVDSEGQTSTRISGSLPEPYEIPDDKLLLSSWLKPWIKDIEIFMAFTVKTNAVDNQSKSTTIEYNSEGRRSYEAYQGNTEYVTKGIKSLGKVNIATGELPDIDLTSVLKSMLPYDTSSSPRNNYGSRLSQLERSTTSFFKEGVDDSIKTEDYTKTEITYGRIDKFSTDASFSNIELFAVVDWDFDNEDPTPFT